MPTPEVFTILVFIGIFGAFLFFRSIIDPLGDWFNRYLCRREIRKARQEAQRGLR